MERLPSAVSGLLVILPSFWIFFVYAFPILLFMRRFLTTLGAPLSRKTEMIVQIAAGIWFVLCLTQLVLYFSGMTDRVWGVDLDGHPHRTLSILVAAAVTAFVPRGWLEKK